MPAQAGIQAGEQRAGSRHGFPAREWRLGKPRAGRV